MIYLNNRLVPNAAALVSVFDRGFLYGDGIYETLRVYNGIVFMIDEHIERLFRSACMIKLKMPRSRETVKRAVYKTVKINRLSDAVVRISISRGSGPIGLDPELCSKPTFVIMANPFKKYPQEYYQKGVNVAIVNTMRNFKGALDPMIKSLNFLNNILAKIEAKERGVYEALMLNYRGYIAEGTITNIFFIKDNILCTPEVDVGILDGITRRIIIDIAKELGIGIKEGRFKRENIYNAQEVFISNTTMEVMPVTAVDNIKIGTKIGNITKMLHIAYKKKVSEYIKKSRE